MNVYTFRLTLPHGCEEADIVAKDLDSAISEALVNRHPSTLELWDEIGHRWDKINIPKRAYSSQTTIAAEGITTVGELLAQLQRVSPNAQLALGPEQDPVVVKYHLTNQPGVPRLTIELTS